MIKILTLNNISPVGIARLPSNMYQVSADLSEPDAIMLRSFDMHGYPIASPRQLVDVFSDDFAGFGDHLGLVLDYLGGDDRVL